MTVVKGKNPETVQKPVDETQDYTGMRLLLDQISEQRTPLITHNGYMDLLYIYDKFYFNLPDT